MKHCILQRVLVPVLMLGSITACGADETRNVYDGGIGTTTYDSFNINHMDGIRRNTVINQEQDLVERYVGELYAYNLNDRIADVVLDVERVSDSVVFVYQNDIVVGIEGHLNQETKRNVHQIVKNQHPGFRIHVTQDSNLFHRIQALCDGSTPKRHDHSTAARHRRGNGYILLNKLKTQTNASKCVVCLCCISFLTQMPLNGRSVHHG